jgi:serine protease
MSYLTLSAPCQASESLAQSFTARMVEHVNKRIIIAVSIASLVPLTPLIADMTPTVTIAAVVESSSGNLSIKRWEIPAKDQSRFERQLDGLAPVLASGVEGRRGVLADPRRDEQWGLARLDVEKLRELGTGTGITVAVVDTGVDGTHADLENAILPGYDLVDAGGNGHTDPNGHGTHVAGIIAAAINGTGTEGLAPGVKILPVRVLGRDGYGDDAVIAQGILWAIRNGAQVVNLSLGGTERDPMLADAIEKAVAAGVIVVAAAGNSGDSGDIMYPAAHPAVIAVGATSADDRAAIFSTRGDYVDVAAPGSMILSTSPGGGYRFESGTSMAAPFVAAAAALMLGRGLAPTEVAARLLASAHDIDVAGFDRASGNGIIDPFAAIKTGTPRTEQPSPVNPSLMPTLPRPNLPNLVLPELTRPSLPAQPPLPLPSLPARPTTPNQPNLPAPSTPALPEFGAPSVPERPRKLSPMATTLGMTVTRSQGKIRVTLSLRTSQFALAYREIDLTVVTRSGSSTKQVRTDASGRAVVTLNDKAARSMSAHFAGDSVTSAARKTSLIGS